MGDWERNIFGMIPTDEWLNVGFSVTRQNDPIDSLFGDEKTNNITARWQSIASEYQIPVMAQFHGFDTESRTTFRVPVDNHNIEKGLIKVKINQSERLRALLRSGVQNNEMYDYVMNDGIRLADQVFTRSKVAKNELLATGKVTIKENNLNLTVDYGVTPSHMNYTLNLNEAADIAGQLQTIIDDASDAGVIITGMVTSKKNITKMRKNLGLQVEINGNSASGQLVGRSALNAYLEDEFGITTIIENDLKYGADATINAQGRPVVTTKRYFPDNKITFFGTVIGGKLGTGLWGDPPEVDDWEIRVNASGVSPYVYVSQWMEQDPHVLWTKASGLFIPVLYSPDSLWGATVTDTTP